MIIILRKAKRKMRENEIQRVADMLVVALRDKPDLTAEIIHDTVYSKSTSSIAAYVGASDLTEEELLRIRKMLEAQLIHKRTLVNHIIAQPFAPWIEESRRAGIAKNYYWEKYKTYLQVDKHFSFDATNSIGEVSERIVGLLGNPNSSSNFARRGMVIGSVQSGKTANYIGVVNKAVDCGYKVIVVLAGLLDSLRSQTQVRIDEGIVGKTIEESDDGTLVDRVVGVGKFSGDKPYSILSLTTATSDFSKRIASTLILNQGSSDDTVYIAVLKKNPGSLKNITSWLDANMRQRPFLLLDDEADNGGVNYRDPATGKLTTINARIRELLMKFDKSVYLGYTATPFANIFIDPDAESQKYGADLYPRDFIVTLDAGDNYVGPDRLFGTDIGDNDDIVRYIDDNEAYIPIRHNKNLIVSDLPPSLKESIRVFLLATTIRTLKGESNFHSTQLVNVSMNTDVHHQVRELIEEELSIILDAIQHRDSLASDVQAQINELSSLFIDHYSATGMDWMTVLNGLEAICASVHVVEVNRENHASDFNYSKKLFPDGRKVIVVGGNALSRGLTLEGLCVSYFLRNSKMYDTLMQMGRWFGYRPDYDYLCRLYMTQQMERSFKFITAATAELVDEFKQMERANLTPDDFGFKVRTHPMGLLITAKNKMRSATELLLHADLNNRMVETIFLPNDGLSYNWDLVNEFVMSLGDETGSAAPCEGKYWTKVPKDVVCDFLCKFKRSEQSVETASKMLCDFIERHPWTQEDDSSVDVCLYAIGNAANQIVVGGNTINQEMRSLTQMDGEIWGINPEKRRLGTPEEERAGLAEIMETDEFINARKNYLLENRTIPGRFYRQFRKRPVLILHVFKDKGFNSGNDHHDHVAAWGLVFPPQNNGKSEPETVSYMVTVRESQNIKAETDDAEVYE